MFIKFKRTFLNADTDAVDDAVAVADDVDDDVVRLKGVAHLNQKQNKKETT